MYGFSIYTISVYIYVLVPTFNGNQKLLRKDKKHMEWKGMNIVRCPENQYVSVTSIEYFEDLSKTGKVCFPPKSHTDACLNEYGMNLTVL